MLRRTSARSSDRANTTACAAGAKALIEGFAREPELVLKSPPSATSARETVYSRQIGCNSMTGAVRRNKSGQREKSVVGPERRRRSMTRAVGATSLHMSINMCAADATSWLRAVERCFRAGGDRSRPPTACSGEVMNRRTVLLVGSDETLLIGLAEMLAAAGHTVVCCRCFEEGKRYLQTDTPHAIVTDVRLGAFNGLHLVLLAKEKEPATTAIVYSGRGGLGPPAGGRNQRCHLFREGDVVCRLLPHLHAIEASAVTAPNRAQLGADLSRRNSPVRLVASSQRRASVYAVAVLTPASQPCDSADRPETPGERGRPTESTAPHCSVIAVSHAHGCGHLARLAIVRSRSQAGIRTECPPRSEPRAATRAARYGRKADKSLQSAPAEQGNGRLWPKNPARNDPVSGLKNCSARSSPCCDFRLRSAPLTQDCGSLTAASSRASGHVEYRPLDGLPPA